MSSSFDSSFLNPIYILTNYYISIPIFILITAWFLLALLVMQDYRERKKRLSFLLLEIAKKNTIAINNKK